MPETCRPRLRILPGECLDAQKAPAEADARENHQEALDEPGWRVLSLKGDQVVGGVGGRGMRDACACGR